MDVSGLRSSGLDSASRTLVADATISTVAGHKSVAILDRIRQVCRQASRREGVQYPPQEVLDSCERTLRVSGWVGSLAAKAARNSAACTRARKGDDSDETRREAKPQPG